MRIDTVITNAAVDFKVKIGTRNERIKIDSPGRFSVYNALAAIAITTKLGCGAEEIKEALIPNDYNMIVTPKEIDDLIENMKDVVARGINFAIN